MGMVELIREMNARFDVYHKEGDPTGRIDQIQMEICDIVRRSMPKTSLTQVVVTDGPCALIVDIEKNRVDYTLERSALFIDSMLDPYGKIDRHETTSVVEDLDFAEVAF